MSDDVTGPLNQPSLSVCSWVDIDGDADGRAGLVDGARGADGAGNQSRTATTAQIKVSTGSLFLASCPGVG